MAVIALQVKKEARFRNLKIGSLLGAVSCRMSGALAGPLCLEKS